jgi:hypothetical protein
MSRFKHTAVEDNSRQRTHKFFLENSSKSSTLTSLDLELKSKGGTDKASVRTWNYETNRLGFEYSSKSTVHMVQQSCYSKKKEQINLSQ